MPPIETIYLIHHSHTDIGYTHDQPIVWEMHDRILLEALDLAERDADRDREGVFRWTAETTAVLQHWLERASARDIDRFIALEQAGRIEVTGMLVNVTPLFDADQLLESFQLLRRLRSDYGLTIQAAMNCDVNGQSWMLPDLLLDVGITGFSMAINPHFGGAMKPRPQVFHWQAPSGRKLLTLNGWTYDKAWVLGIGRDADELEHKWWGRAQAYLDQIGYSLPMLMLQAFHPFGDNGTVFDYTPFIEAWNAAGKSPRIIMATPRMWWAAVQPYVDQLPTLRGDWTEFWSFGCISSAREEAIHRCSRARLRTADALLGTTRPFSQDRWLERSQYRREEAWWNLNLWGEHSWGADDSVWQPDSEDTLSQWYHKAAYLYHARSLSLMLQRDALAELARHVAREQADDLLIFNPLPWERQISGAVRPAIANPRGLLTDSTASRHHLDRHKTLRWHPEDLDTLPDDTPRLLLPPTCVPGLGYAVVSRQNLQVPKAILATTETDVVENQRFRLQLDRERGGILSLYDKTLNWEWVQPHSHYALHTVVHEQVADAKTPIPRKRIYDHPWPTEEVEIPSGWKRYWRAIRTSPSQVNRHQVYETALGYAILQEVILADFTIQQRIFLPHTGDYIECEAAWHMGLTVHPEAMYVVFPFHVPDATARFDLGGQALTPGQEQLAGVCRDYFTAQGWVDFSNDRLGVTIALPENPLFQLGDFHFGDYQADFKLGQSTLLGWVTSNYWETNFRAHQPGLVHSRYRIYPHANPFDEAQAHRFGLEAAYAEPVLQHLGETPLTPAPLPREGSLLVLPDLPIYTLHVKSGERGVIIRLLNSSDQAQPANITSGLLHLKRAYRCDVFEQPETEIPLQNGTITLEIPPRRMVVIQLDVAL